MDRRTLLTGMAGIGAVALVGCGDKKSPTATPTTATPTPTATTTTTEAPPHPAVADTIASGLDVPWGIAFLASGDALVGLRNKGEIIKISAAGKVSTIGDVSGVMAPTGIGEGGLLGIAFAPGDENTLFAYITTAGDNRIVTMDFTGGKLGTPRAILTGIPASTHHNGGRLLFDDAGHLFVSTGDAEQSQRAQDKSSLGGKILRVGTDGKASSGNPFDNRTWSYGHRNIEGLAFDSAGRLWATEFGEKATDELNLIKPGRNYGWPDVEGTSNNSAFTNPKATWQPTSACSPAGIAITRSTAFVGALQGQCLFAVALDGEDAGKPKAYFAEEYGRIRSVTVAPDDSLWVTTSNTDGRIDPKKVDDRILRVTL